ATLNNAGKQAAGTILDDDEKRVETPRASIADASAFESAGSLIFNVNLSKSYSETVAVQYETKPKSADAGQDYVASSGVLSFAPGETETTLQIELIDDAVDEPDETFVVVLTDPVNAVLAGAGDQAEGTILDDDASVSEKMTICHYPPGKAKKAKTLTISRSAWTAHEAHGDTVGACSE
ncbi:MAG: Calx-beta domain-containing protein, partial [Balneolaceae bacterium]|nr:Calx-beta domain-containing protein [Balneolaceae bacterium]